VRRNEGDAKAHFCAKSEKSEESEESEAGGRAEMEGGEKTPSTRVARSGEASSPDASRELYLIFTKHSILYLPTCQDKS